MLGFLSHKKFFFWKPTLIIMTHEPYTSKKFYCSEIVHRGFSSIFSVHLCNADVTHFQQFYAESLFELKCGEELNWIKNQEEKM
jgi:hypothetical protein